MPPASRQRATTSIVLMDNLMLWLRGDDGRLFQLANLRCTDGLIILELVTTTVGRRCVHETIYYVKPD